MKNFCCCTIYEVAGDIKIGNIAEIGLIAADFRGIAHAAQDTERFCSAIILYPSCRREVKNVVLVLKHLHHKIKDKKRNILETDQSTRSL